VQAISGKSLPSAIRANNDSTMASHPRWILKSAPVFSTIPLKKNQGLRKRPWHKLHGSRAGVDAVSKGLTGVRANA